LEDLREILDELVEALFLPESLIRLKSLKRDRWSFRIRRIADGRSGNVVKVTFPCDFNVENVCVGLGDGRGGNMKNNNGIAVILFHGEIADVEPEGKALAQFGMRVP
jgi:hypothetical protein